LFARCAVLRVASYSNLVLISVEVGDGSVAYKLRREKWRICSYTCYIVEFISWNAVVALISSNVLYPFTQRVTCIIMTLL